MTPLLSVLMTAYNRERYIAEAIESVLASSYKNFELIIVDDGSEDSTVEIIRSYANSDKRIRFFINNKNLGDYRNRNQAASYAQGDYLMYVDSDDQILADGFEQCIQTMQQFPDAGIGMQYSNQTMKPFCVPGEIAIQDHFFKKPQLMIGPGGTIMRKSFFESIGRYPVQYGPANDLYFNLKAVSKAGVVFLPFSFNYYRIHEGQEMNNKFSYLYNNFRYLRDAICELDLPLTKEQKEWVLNKNRRRFLVNLFQFFLHSKNIKKTLQAKRLASFGWFDLWKALVHPSL